MAEIQTLQDIIRYSVKTYGSQAAYRYKEQKEIVDKTYEDVADRMLGDLDLSVFRPGVDVRMLLEEIDSYLMRCVWQMLSAGKLDPDGLEKDFLKRVGQWRTAYLK